MTGGVGLYDDETKQLGEINPRVPRNGNPTVLIGDESVITTHTVVAQIVLAVLQRARTDKWGASKPYDHYNPAIDLARAFANGDIARVDNELSPERFQQALEAEHAKLKTTDAEILDLQSTTAVKREGVQTRSGDTATTESASKAEVEKLESLQKERAAISENLTQLADSKRYAFSVDCLLFAVFDLVIGATKDDPDNLLRDVRSDYSKSVIQRGELATGRGLLMAIEARITAHREVLRDELMRMVRPEHASWEGILAIPRRMAERIEALCHVCKVLYSREEVPPVLPAATFARHVLATHYTNDVTYEPFLSKFVAPSSLTMEDLAKQIKDNCNSVPFLWDKDLTRVGAFVATTMNPKPHQLTSPRKQGSRPSSQLRRGGGKGGKTGRSTYKEGNIRGCNHCASMDHFVADCQEYKNVQAIREARAQQ
ncbi:unnamed protein product [Bathycoccus prasinos]